MENLGAKFSMHEQSWELEHCAKRISATTPSVKVCSSSVCVSNALPEVFCAVSLLFQKSASVQGAGKGSGVATRGLYLIPSHSSWVVVVLRSGS